MNKYINVEKLKTEIERRRDIALERQKNLEKIGQETVLNEMIAFELNKVLFFIDSLQQENEIIELSFKGGTYKVNGEEKSFKGGKRMKYIDAEKLIAEIENMFDYGYYCTPKNIGKQQGRNRACREILSIIASLQQEHPIEGKQVIIITETDGDANIHWDCRSLDDAMALLKSAESFITDKQVEKMAGPGSGPDYATEEGRYSYLFKHRRKQPEVDFEEEWEKFEDWVESYIIKVII